jgi:transposase
MMYDEGMTYPLKLRQQVLRLKEKEKLSNEEAGKRFGIPRNTVQRWTKKLEPKGTTSKTWVSIDPEKLLADVKEYPDAYHYERANRLGASDSGICDALKRLGITRKKNVETSES